MKRCGIALLAAGKGTRMGLDFPKALAPLMGKKLIDFGIEVVDDFSKIVGIKPHFGVVVGHQKEQVLDHLAQNYLLRLNQDMTTAWQKQQLGTADALRSYFDQTPEAWANPYTMVICADTPLITADVLIELYKKLEHHQDLQAVAATFRISDPFGYGRIIRAGKSFHIVEEKDATFEQREIQEVNSGLYIFRTSYIKKHLNEIDSHNEAKEFYLTDLFKKGELTSAMLFNDAHLFYGINDQQQLETAAEILLKRKIKKIQNQGVLISSKVQLDWDVEIGFGSIIEPSVVLKGKTVVGKNVLVESGCYVKNSVICDQAQLLAYSYIENSIVGEKSHVGPFARLRPETHLGAQCKIGNFVEIKKSKLKQGAKVSHLSYVGDAEIGEQSNIGCGFITCNYDGVKKHKTFIGDRTFIGSDCQTIAPVSIGSDAFVAAGSTLTQDIPDGGFAIARTRQVTKENMAKRFLKTKDSK